jgi:hypothetical protein
MAALRLRVWFERRGESPQRPYAVKRSFQDRYVSVPQELLDDYDPMSICTEFGETPEP